VNPFVRLELDAGHYHPRIARPLGNNAGSQALWCPGAYGDQNMIASARSQAEGLTAQLARICRTIHPCPETFSTYGHDIRNLLILAATEVEMSCRGALKANGSTRARLSMNEYVALADVMGLQDFAVRFPTFPWLETIKPFEGWSSLASLNLREGDAEARLPGSSWSTGTFFGLEAGTRSPPITQPPIVCYLATVRPI
jgi:hypothetical protein